VKAQAEVSLYPLRKADLSEPIRRFRESLEAQKLDVRSGAMSTTLSGELSEVFSGLQAATETAMNAGDMVVVLKLSNACPSPEATGGRGLTLF
jgi:uncharacterized protein YqgV (UPF0045/DUF77 family)